MPQATEHGPKIVGTSEALQVFTIGIRPALLQQYLGFKRFPQEYLDLTRVLFSHVPIDAKNKALTATSATDPRNTFGEFLSIWEKFTDGTERRRYEINLNAPLIAEVSEMGLRISNAGYQADITPDENASSVLIHEFEHLWEHIRRVRIAKGMGRFSLRKILEDKSARRRLDALEEEERVRARTRRYLREKPELGRLVLLEPK